MSDGDLLTDESVQYKGRLHWGIFVPPMLLTLVATAGAIALIMHHQFAIASAVFVIGLVFVLPAFVRYQTNGLTLTNKRVIFRSGIVARKSMDIALGKIEGVSVDQTICGQVLNYGTVIVRGTGGGIEAFSRLAAPAEFSKHLHQQISR